MPPPAGCDGCGADLASRGSREAGRPPLRGKAALGRRASRMAETVAVWRSAGGRTATVDCRRVGTKVWRVGGQINQWRHAPTPPSPHPRRRGRRRMIRTRGWIMPPSTMRPQVAGHAVRGRIIPHTVAHSRNGQTSRWQRRARPVPVAADVSVAGKHSLRVRAAPRARASFIRLL